MFDQDNSMNSVLLKSPRWGLQGDNITDEIPPDIDGIGSVVYCC